MTPLHQVFLGFRLTNRADLHLVTAKGRPVNPLHESAVRRAFLWARREFPQVDPAQIANWAEEVFMYMQESPNEIERPTSYANSALRGKVLDWKRLSPANVHLAGMERDLERLGGHSSSFQGTLERSLLFYQVGLSLEERDRYILTLLRDDKSSAEIAAALKITDAAARKAVQRLKERLAVILLGESRGPALVFEAEG